MNEKAARKLKVGDYVTWQEEMTFTTPRAIAASTGEVTEVAFSGYKVKWGDGLVCQYRFINSNHIHRLD